MFDIVFNRDLVGKSKALGFKEVFCLDKALVIKTEKKEEVIRKVSSFHSKNIPVIILGSADEINRMAVEDKRASMLLNPEETRKKDFMHWKNSGLNHVLCRLAAQNNVKIGISFSSLADLKGRDRASRLGRIMQNIVLCRKYKTKMLIASFAESEAELLSPYELKSLALTLGMTPAQANQSLETAKEIFS